MEYMRGWRALRQDPDWKRKIGVGSLLFFSSAFIPLAGQLALLGWLTLAARRAVQGNDTPLPDLRFDFDYLGKLLGIGLKPWVARVVWTMPAVFVMIVLITCMGVVGGVVAGATARDGGGPGIVMPILMLAAYALAFGVMFFAQLFANVAGMRAMLMGEIGPAIRPGEVLRTTRLLAKELIVGHIVLGFISFGFILVGMLACYFGIFPAACVLSVIGAYYNAELYRAYLAKGGQPLPIAELDVPQPNAPAPAPNAF